MKHKPTLSKLLFFLVLFLGAGYGFAMTIQASAAVLPPAATTQLPASHDLDCLPTAYGLEDLIDCVTAYMPAKDSNAYVTPTVAIQNDWQTVVADMVSMTHISECSAISLPESLEDIYAIFPFVDAYSEKEFCVAIEVEDFNNNNVIDRGWGTFIVNPEPDRYLNIDITHAIEDDMTHQEGIQIFRGVGAHTFLMSGANREANDVESPCQDGEKIADVAHCTDNLFFPAVVAMDTYYTANSIEHTAIQFHGMADDDFSESGCPNVNVYITHGSANGPQQGDSILTLRNVLRDLQPSWKVAVPGEPSPLLCGKNGTQNVQGRFLNGLDEADVCDDEVDPVGYSGKFIHIEQHPDSDLVEYRSPAVWIEALKSTFPPLTPPVSTTAVSFQDGVAPDANYFGTTDTWIGEGEEEAPFGAAEICEADGDDSAALLRWDISSLPAGSVVQAAEITLRVTSATDPPGFHAFPLHPNWVELEAIWETYSNGNEWEEEGAQGVADHAAVPIGRAAPGGTGFYTFIINPVQVQEWFDNSASNKGVLLVNLDNSDGLDFHCSETSTASNRPKLTIHYSESGGGTPTPTPTPIVTPTPTPSPTPTPAEEIIYMGFSTSPTLGGVGYRDEDILAYDSSSGSWSLFIDGSDIGLDGPDANDVDAFYILPNGDLLFSFNEATSITGVGAVDSYDIIRFVPTSTGSSTAGTFSMYFDGSDVGLDTLDENITGIAMSAAGNLLITTKNSGNVGFSFKDEDLLEFEATQLGANTSGSWSFFFDGSDAGVGSMDVRDFWVDDANNIYLTFDDTFGSVGDEHDIFLCVPSSLGSNTSCTGGVTQYWDGSTHGVTSWRPDNLFIAR